MVVVFGSANVDLITHVKQLPACGETVLGGAIDKRPGGKGANQALAARCAGADVVFVGCVGFDQHAEQAMENLRKTGVDLSRIQRSHKGTGQAIVIVEELGQNQIVVVPGANEDIKAEHALHGMKSTDVLLMQLEIPLKEVTRAARAAKEVGATVILNCAPYRPIPTDLIKYTDVLFANEVELTLLSGSSGRDLVQDAKNFAGLHKLTVVVTGGAKGAIATNKHFTWFVSAPQVDVADSVGAGDAAAGAFAAAWSKKYSLAECLRHAVANGSLACTIGGAQGTFSPALRKDMLQNVPAATQLDSAAVPEAAATEDGLNPI